MITLTSAQQAIIKNELSIKQFTVHFPNNDFTDLTNENIVYQSVKFTESVCSDSVFRFGCADASMITFETVGVPNILGAVIECSMAFILGADTVTVPYGRFTVTACPRDHKAMQHRQITAYAETVSNGAFEQYKQATPRYSTDTYTPAAVYMIGAVSERMRDDMTATAVTPYKESTTLPTPFTLMQTNTVNGKYIRLTEAGGTKNVSMDFNGETVTPAWLDADYIYSIRLIKGADYDTYISLLYETAEANGLTVCDNMINAALFADLHTAGRSAGQRYFRYTDKGTYLELAIYPYIGSQTLGEYLNYSCYYGAFDLVLYNGSADEVIASGLDVISDVELVRYSSPLTSIRLSYKTTQTAKDVNGRTYNTFIGTYSVRDVVEGWAELNASFGRCNRDGTLEFIRLDNSNPYDLTAEDVEGAAWWDEYNINPIGSVLFKYRSENEEMTAQYVFSSDPSVYDMTANKILSCLTATVATATVPADMTNTAYFYIYDGYVYFYDGTAWVQTVLYEGYGSICMALIKALFIPHADTVLFTPFDAELNGMPFLQCGDAVRLTAADNTVINSYILAHTFSGLQHITEDVDTVQGEVIA